MSVPLDRLYNHLDGLCNHDTIIYRFFPHGSKNLENVAPIKDIDNLDRTVRDMSPIMFCHDQEPLQPVLSNKDLHQQMSQMYSSFLHLPGLTEMIEKIPYDMSIRSIFGTRFNAYDRMLLVHSEKNSSVLQSYIDVGFEPVYWWSHAAIAADWFRYAQHDVKLNYTSQFSKDFLIYNRAWSGTREYRLKFVELLLDHSMQQHCQMRFNPVCSDNDYKNFRPQNPVLKCNRRDLEQHFEINVFDSAASADYTTDDYVRHGLEIVLETLFDDSRLHLTEKVLRPIACGKPFMLAATPGSLEYLRSYGFETFDGLINESYDSIQDPVQRLHAIAKEMQRIANLPPTEKQQFWSATHSIAARNKQIFFDSQWQQSIFDEFVENYNTAFRKIQPTTGHWWKYYRDNFTRENEPGLDPGNSRDQTVLKWLASRL